MNQGSFIYFQLSVGTAALVLSIVATVSRIDSKKVNYVVAYGVILILIIEIWQLIMK